MHGTGYVSNTLRLNLNLTRTDIERNGIYHAKFMASLFCRNLHVVSGLLKVLSLKTKITAVDERRITYAVLAFKISGPLTIYIFQAVDVVTPVDYHFKLYFALAITTNMLRLNNHAYVHTDININREHLALLKNQHTTRVNL